MVVQQNLDGTLNFNRLWVDYRNGFGVYNSDFWFGLKPLYQLTSVSGASYRLRIELQAAANGIWFSAEYSSFYVNSEAVIYAIHLSRYSGDAGTPSTKTVRAMF